MKKKLEEFEMHLSLSKSMLLQKQQQHIDENEFKSQPIGTESWSKF